VALVIYYASDYSAFPEHNWHYEYDGAGNLTQDAGEWISPGYRCDVH